MPDFITHAIESAQGMLDPALATGGGLAAVLAAIWVFFRVLRSVVAMLFMLCVVYLVLKICFGIDLSGWLAPLLQGITSSPAP